MPQVFEELFLLGFAMFLVFLCRKKRSLLFVLSVQKQNNSVFCLFEIQSEPVELPREVRG